ncbi:hypothetical protein Nepgr_018309 [Nepenthes gracilis]|uniref:Uncharacterized protein n=1 Tax=Nepenthes gracilis TaxID=150966 RepID=A0AAD3XTB6_NEPGR|nr:hypothetical protein Nepgr_018309 [Nepenthes gracilis]
MDMSGSGWSSGCESGWTVYFEEFSLPENQWQGDNSNRHGNENYRVNPIREEEDEEDLSMVSDASSGPPHFQEYYDQSGDYCSPSETGSKKSDKRGKKKGKEQRAKHQQHSSLDDTASSPAFGYSKRNVTPTGNQASIDHVMGFSQNFSAAQFQGNSEYTNHYRFWQPSHSKKPEPAEPSHAKGRRRK